MIGMIGWFWRDDILLVTSFLRRSRLDLTYVVFARTGVLTGAATDSQPRYGTRDEQITTGWRRASCASRLPAPSASPLRGVRPRSSPAPPPGQVTRVRAPLGRWGRRAYPSPALWR